MIPLKKLQKLKKMLQEADRFDTVMDYFLTHFAEQPAFLSEGKPVRHERLVGIITMIAEQMIAAGFIAADKPQFSGLLLVKIRRQKFIHGAFFLCGMPGSVIYFEDIDMGMVSVSNFRGQTNFARVRTADLPDGWEPSWN